MSEIRAIRSVPQGSGMHVDTGTYDVGEQTAFAPGFSSADQIVWYASTIVHDAHHRYLYRSGDPYVGRDAELACLEWQREALGVIEAGDNIDHFRSYVQGLVDGIDDPDHEYWNQPDRHW